MKGIELHALGYYVGPTPAKPTGVCEFFPFANLALYEDSGYFAMGWLFWAFEVNWKRRP